MEDTLFPALRFAAHAAVCRRAGSAFPVRLARLPVLTLLLCWCALAQAGEPGNPGGGLDEGSQPTLKPQTISFPAIAGPVTYGTPPIQLQAQASSGLAVSFKVESGPGVIEGGTLVITAVGNVLVAATQIGNSNYAPAPPVTQNLQVEPGPLTVRALNLYMKPGATVPPLVYKIWGFANGDTQSKATTGKPSLSTTVTSQSPAGVYSIVVKVGTLAAANYTFSAVNGAMTVTDRAVNFMGDSQTQGSIHGNCEHSWPKPGVPPCWTNLVQEQKSWRFHKDISQDGNRWGDQLKLMFQSATGGPLLYQPDTVTIAGLGQNDADDFSSIFVNCAQNPRQGDTLTLNGTPVTFVNTSPSGNQVEIGGTPGETCRNLQRFACPAFSSAGCGSSDPNIARSLYTNLTANGAAAVEMHPVVSGYVQTVATSDPGAFTLQQLATPDQISAAIQTQVEAAAIFQTTQPASQAEGGIASLIPGQSMTVSGAPCKFDEGGIWGTGYFIACDSSSTLSFTTQGSDVYVVYQSGSALSSTFTVSVTCGGVTRTSPPISTSLRAYGPDYLTASTYRMATPSASQVSRVTINFLSGTTEIGFGASNGNAFPVSGQSWFAVWETFDAVNNLDSVYAAIRLGEQRAVQQLAADSLPVIDVPVGESFNCQQNPSLCTRDGQHQSTAAMQTFANYFLDALSPLY